MTETCCWCRPLFKQDILANIWCVSVGCGNINNYLISQYNQIWWGISRGWVSGQCGWGITETYFSIGTANKGRFTLWDEALQNISPAAGLIIPTRLGSYLRKGHLHRHWFLSENKTRLFFLDPMKNIEEKYAVYEKRGSRYTTRHVKPYQWHSMVEEEPPKHFFARGLYSQGLDKVKLHSIVEVPHIVVWPNAFWEVL